jgi:hypothetical protein
MSAEKEIFYSKFHMIPMSKNHQAAIHVFQKPTPSKDLPEGLIQSIVAGAGLSFINNEGYYVYIPAGVLEKYTLYFTPVEL